MVAGPPGLAAGGGTVARRLPSTRSWAAAGETVRHAVYGLVLGLTYPVLLAPSETAHAARVAPPAPPAPQPVGPVPPP
jgi:hypothetical protein